VRCPKCKYLNTLFTEKREINLYYNVQEKFINCICCNQIMKIIIENELKTNVNVERID
jgi:phage FluMu protein Com